MKIAAISLLFPLLTGVVRGQSALDGFDPNANGTIGAVVVQPDGKILIGGTFSTLSPNGGAPVTRNHIARLNPDGTLDTAFNPNANEFVLSIAVQADGKILVGGLFTSIGGQTRNHIARLDATTGLADSFDPNANEYVSTITVQADGKILAGGLFTDIGGQTRSRIARLDAITGLADSFNPNASEGFVSTIVVQADGKILVGGNFSAIGGQPRIGIARLDGTTGLADSFDPSPNGRVDAIAVQADGKILVGGQFFLIQGQTRNHMARLDATTGLPDSFDPNPSFPINSIALQADGKILVGGGFQFIGGQLRNRIARLDPATSLADSFDPNSSDFVRSIAIQADGKVLAGGEFTTLTPNGGATVTRNNIARLETDGRVDQTVDLDIAGSVIGATAVQPDGKILIGGHFSNLGTATSDNMARLNTDGTFDAAFDPNPNGYTSAIAVQPNGRVLAGGDFTSIGGAMRNRIARLDAVTGLADSFDPNANDIIEALAVQGDGKILVCGAFTTIGGQTRNHIARIDPVTGLADSFDPNANNVVYAIAVQADGKIVAGGAFTSIGGATRNRIARLDATTGLADSFNPNANDDVYAIGVQTDGRILVGGGFSGVNSIGGQTRNHITRLDATTGLADSFNPDANVNVFSIAVQADGMILAGGGFNMIGGQSRNFIARLNSTTGLADSFNPNAGNWVNSIAVQADGKILAGGSFNDMGGQTRHRLARLSNDTAVSQSLAVTQNAIFWTRGGSSPPFKRVTFEHSTDNVTYSSLGNGTWLGGNDWILAGLNLPAQQNIYVRARGHYQGGLRNGSESITESVRYGPAGPPGPTPTPMPTATATPTPMPTPVCVTNPVVTTSADGGPGSLRQAISDACLGGTITFDMDQVVSPITLSGALGSDADITISGPGADQLTISGNDNASVFRTAVRSPDVVTLSGLSLVNGASPQGGIYLSGDGTLNIANCIVSNNVSTTSGGGIYNSKAGTINVSNSMITNNSTPGAGGGVLNEGVGTVNITNSTISNNSSFFTGSGGGLTNSSTGTVSVTNSTVSGNSASGLFGAGSGGGILNGAGTIRLINTTVTNNSAGNSGGGILNGSGLVQLWNSIVALNEGTNSGPDLNGAFTTLGHNLIGQNDGSTGFTPGVGNPNGDLVGTTASPIDPRLGALANNGGPTLTHLLESDSLAIEAGDNAAVTDPPFSGPPFYDQRGVGFPRILNTTVDIGAVEVGPTPIPTATPTPSPSPSSTPTPTETPTPSAGPTTLGNISTRLKVETGDNALIGGFIVTGTQSKRVIVRAIGPSLSSFFPGALANPILELRDSAGGLIMANDNWRSAQETEIMATGIPPSNDLESAIVQTLPANGSAYTVIVRGLNEGTGIAVVEAYDLDQTVDSKLANISTRGLVQAGDDAMIAGTIVLGQASQRVLVRAIGPSLPIDGKLADPTLELRDGDGTLIRANDNWRSDQEQEIIATTIPPQSDLESAIVHTLPAGGAAYTAIVRGVNNATGVALVEVYALN